MTLDDLINDWNGPASKAARALAMPSPRSLWPCQSMRTGWSLTTSSLMNRSRRRTPSGVAWPQVSERQMAWAPSSRAAV
jgi:hypothetical protein